MSEFRQNQPHAGSIGPILTQFGPLVWILISQSYHMIYANFPPFRHFPNFSALWKHTWTTVTSDRHRSSSVTLTKGFLATWWRHQMETFSALLDICAGNSPVPSEFPAQRPVTWSFDCFFDLSLNKRLSKQSWGWWFEMLLCPLWRHCNVYWPSWLRFNDVIWNWPHY